MILIDTNVISEPLRRVPDTRVVEWLDAQALETLYICAITVAELRFRVKSLPEGRRRKVLNDGLEQEVLPMFAGRILAFGLAESQAFAELMASVQSIGRSISIPDGYIAATAVANSMMVASRDMLPLETVGLKTINPWKN